MADTWDANAANQLFTLKALRNACNLGYYGYSTLPPDTREIATFGDLSTYGITYLGGGSSTNMYNTFTSPNNSQAVVKSRILMGEYLYNGTKAFACSGGTGTLEMMYSSGTTVFFQIGDQLYSNRARTTTKTFATQGWIPFGPSNYIQVSTAGVILNTAAC